MKIERTRLNTRIPLATREHAEVLAKEENLPFSIWLQLLIDRTYEQKIEQKGTSLLR